MSGLPPGGFEKRFNPAPIPSRRRIAAYKTTWPLETRYRALGKTNEPRRLHIMFTLRRGNTTIRVISARGMSVKERIAYEQSS